MQMKRLLLGCLGAGLLLANLTQAQETNVNSAKADTPAIEFEAPVQLKVGDHPIKVESPGYAFPSLADMNGDGRKDLLVGQFAGGKINVYHANEKDGFGPGQWLKAQDKTVEVPGIW